MAVALDDAWVEGLVEASRSAAAPVDRSAVVEFTIGKTKRAVVEVSGGRVVGSAEAGSGNGNGDDGIDLSIPLTAAQLESFASGAESMSQAYMRGDLKPVGSTGALLAILALFDDPAFRQALPPSP